MGLQKQLLPLAVTASMALLSAGAQASAETNALRAQIQALTERLDQLEQQATVATQKAEAAEAKAEAASGQGILSGNENVRVTVSGHVNRGLLYADDGRESETYNVDNDSSSTRLRVIGEADVSDDLTIGSAIEAEFESNSSFAVNQNNETTDISNGNGINQRRLEVYFDSKRYGKLWLGQGSSASDGTSEVDLSGTDLVGYSSTADIAGAILFRNSDGTLSTTEVGNVFSNFDGQGRGDRIRYDTPTFGNFTVSASVIDGETWDSAIRYAGELDGAKLAAALAYSEPRSSDVDSQVNGSVSLLLDNGLNFTLAAGERDVKSGDNPAFYYGKVGYQMQLFSHGMTAVSVDYSQNDDLAAQGDEGENYGLQLVQNFDKWSTEGYLGYRNYQLDRAAGNVDDIDAIILGARVKF